MSKVICEREDLVAIADAIRSKTGETNEMTLAEIKSKINNEKTCVIGFHNFSPYAVDMMHSSSGNERIHTHISSYQSSVTNYVLCNSYITIYFDKYSDGNETLSLSAPQPLDVNAIDSGYFYEIFVPYNAEDTDIYINWEDCCFIAGTQIKTSLDGDSVSIETIKSGDSVVSYDVTTKENYIATVKKLIINRNTTDIAEVYFDNESMLTMNAYHPIYTKDGFHSITKHNNYGELIVGDVVRTIDGWTTVTKINRYKSEPIITYNLDVVDIGEEIDNEINDTYYANGIVVHNAACK